MFGLFKSNPLKKLEKAYDTKLKEARDAQRSGNIQSYAALSAEAEAIHQDLERLRQSV